jgi:uncharacterized pyridoxal phosphate-containing UPF0001 family protein
MSEGIAERLRALRGAIDQELRDNGRDPASVTLVGIGKRQGSDAISSAIAAGLSDLGESYLQEARHKFP